MEYQTAVEPSFEKMGLVITDRYEEKHPEDHDLWIELLSMAAADSDLLYGCLEYLRAVGTILVPDSKFGYRMRPVISDTTWCSEAQYKKEALFLMPYKSKLVEFFLKLKRWSDGKHKKAD